MTSGEATAINNRLDRQEAKMDTLLEKVSAQSVVLGARLVKLETISGLRSKGFWVMVGLVSTITSGCVVSGVLFLLKG